MKVGKRDGGKRVADVEREDELLLPLVISSGVLLLSRRNGE